VSIILPLLVKWTMSIMSSTTYLNGDALHLVSMLQLQMLVSKLVILILGVHKQH
jgi:hypothetical protein